MTSDRIDAALEFARPLSRGVLMTLKQEGGPQASNIMYATFDGGVHVSVTDDRAKTVNLRRDPRAALHVTSPDFGRWAVLEGGARLSEVTASPGDDAGNLLRRVYEAIAGPHPDWDDYDRAMIAERRLVVSIPVTHAYGQGFW
ncbi:PPOX class F420-dependent oxidoreductase [soil metagenome]